MKKLLLLIIILLASCSNPEDPTEDYSYDSDYVEPKKEIITYNLTFTAKHWVDQESQFTDPYAYYSLEVNRTDENGNKIVVYDKSDFVIKSEVSGTATAKSGDTIFIYISVNDVYCNGRVTCKSTDGKINIFETTDNLYINESRLIIAQSKSLGNTIRTNKYILK